MLDYIPEIKDCPQAMDKIAELIAKMPEKRIEGTLAPEVEAKMWDYREQYVDAVTERLAVGIDQFSYDYNTYEYHDAITDREEAVNEIKQSLSVGDAEYLKDWLQEIVTGRTSGRCKGCTGTVETNGRTGEVKGVQTACQSRGIGRVQLQYD